MANKLPKQDRDVIVGIVRELREMDAALQRIADVLDPLRIAFVPGGKRVEEPVPEASMVKHIDVAARRLRDAIYMGEG